LERVGNTYVQLCGRFVVELRGRRVEQRLPSRQGRLLFAYLVLQRPRAVGRDELVEAIWAAGRPANHASALTVLLSKLRAAVGADVLVGRGRVNVALPPGARLDVEEALAALHRAQSAVAQGEWARAWSAALCARYVTARPLLPDHDDQPWLDSWRRRLDDAHQGALEAYAAACLGLGGTEIAGAERAARRLLERNPSVRPATACSWRPWPPAATWPRRSTCMSAPARCFAMNWASRPAQSSTTSTQRCSAINSSAPDGSGTRRPLRAAPRWACVQSSAAGQGSVRASLRSSSGCEGVDVSLMEGLAGGTPRGAPGPSRTAARFPCPGLRRTAAPTRAAPITDGRFHPRAGLITDGRPPPAPRRSRTAAPSRAAPITDGRPLPAPRRSRTAAPSPRRAIADRCRPSLRRADQGPPPAPSSDASAGLYAESRCRPRGFGR
jgi:DNA-binding SARP family transcriptional activator